VRFHLPLFGRAVAVVAAFALALAAAPGRAEPVVDQIADGEGTSGGQSYVDIEREFAQTFTVGLAGVLTRIDVKLQGFESNTGPLLYDVLPLEGDGSPVEDPAQALATGIVPFAAILIGGWDFVAIERLAIPVELGDRLAIVLRVPPESSDATSWLVEPVGYAGGSRFCRGACSAQWNSLGTSFQFRTWVDPAIELDQFADTLDPSSGQSFVDSVLPEFAQTFQVGRSGTLTRFDVKLQAGAADDDLQWHLLPVEPSGFPVEDLGLARASGTIPAEAVPPFPEPWDWVSVEGLALPVEAEERLALVLSLPPETTTWYSWILANPVYPDGSRYCRRPSAEAPCALVWNDATNDFRFRTFLVAAPEPDAGLATVAAAGALAAIARRRRGARIRD
jgi:hypothetical protein